MPTSFSVVLRVEFSTCREGKTCSGALEERTHGGDFVVCALGTSRDSIASLIF